MSTPNRGSQVDMIHGPMAKKILLFALPIGATSILQQLFNSVDVAVVGHYVGTGALAAVGTNTPVIGLFINCLSALSVGATVTISHAIGLMEQDGEDRTERIQKIVHSSVLFSLLFGIMMMIIGLFIAGTVMELVGAPKDIIKEATLYLRIYFLAAPAIMVYNFLSAILRSIGDTKRPLLVLTASGVLNVILNLILVIQFHRGVEGVAIATVISNLFSAAALWILLTRETSFVRLSTRKLSLDGAILKRILRIGGPAAMQGMFFCFSNICIQSGINSLGSKTVAAAAATQTLINFVFYMVSGFNQATLAFAGQNYGAGEEKRCKKVLAISMTESIVIASIMVTAFLVLRYQVLSLFTDSREVMEIAIIQMKLSLGFYCMVCVYETTGAWLRARGHSLEPALVVIVGSVFFRILWLNTAFRLEPTFARLMVVYPLSWVVTIVIMTTVAVVLTRRDGRKRAR